VRQIAQKALDFFGPAMNALGQQRKWVDLFDHLVGQQLERVRHGEAEGSGGLEINDQFVFERELNGQIARILRPAKSGQHRTRAGRACSS